MVEVDETAGCPARVVDGDGTVVEDVTTGATAPDGMAGHGAIVKDGHDEESKFLTLPHSL